MKSDCFPSPVKACAAVLNFSPSGEQTAIPVAIPERYRTNGNDLPDQAAHKVAELEAELAEARQREARLAENVQHLERMLRSAGDRALAQFDRLTRLKEEFVNNMNHELRTPLNGILGMANIGLRAADSEKSRHACLRIVEAGQKLSEMVENVLDFSRLDAGQSLPQPICIALGEIIEFIALRTSQQAAAKGLAFEYRSGGDLPTFCVIDRQCLYRILKHLLGNALKFTDRGSITLTARRDGACLVFTVADTGIGISADHARQLFRPFEQADGSSSRRFGGMGLGLALTDYLVRQMGGAIQVESVQGQGSSFEVRLPYVEPPEAVV